MDDTNNLRQSKTYSSSNQDIKKMKLKENIKKKQELESIPEIIFHSIDMNSENKQLVTNIAIQCYFEKYISKSKTNLSSWMDVAQRIKQEFQNHNSGTWHCVVGEHFGSFFTYEIKTVAYFYIGHMGVLLWKHG